MGSSKAQTVGYRYHMGMHMGLGRGPVDEIVEIKVGDRTAWSGSITASGSVSISKPQLFGGDEREGGIVGNLQVLMGEPTQNVFAPLASMLGGLVPAFRGITTLFFNGQYAAMNPYPKPWAIRRRRALQGWDGGAWYPERAMISLADGAIRAMNPAHIIYESLTNRDWGRGWSRTVMDDTLMRAAADRFYSEGMGLCLRWTRQDRLSSFVQSVLDHVMAGLVIDRSTGLRAIVPIRDDYDPDSLPLYTPDTGLLAIDDDSNAAQGVNEVIVKYIDPLNGGKEAQVRVQNAASIQSLRGKLTLTKDYPGISTADLALRLAQRDLLANSGLVKRFRLRFDRRAWGERPSSVFRISHPRGGIQNMVLRAVKVEHADGGDGTITITAVLDVYSLPATAYVGHQGNAWAPPSAVPTAIATRKLMEATWRDLVRSFDAANLELVPDTASYLGALALRPQSLALGYDIFTRVGTTGDFLERARSAFTPTGTLNAVLLIGEGSAIISDGESLDEVQPGTAALIGDELVRIDTINASTGAITFGRGCVDTVPVEHAAGTRVWFLEDSTGDDPTEYTTGNTVQVRLLTVTGQGRLDIGSALTDSIVMAQRQHRPYPPGNLQINGSAYPDTITGDLSVTWSHRDRIVQADQLVDTTEGNIGPEPGVTYTLRIYNGATLERTVTGITGTGYTYANADELADGGPFNPIRFTLHAVRDGLESGQGHDCQVARS